MAPRRLQVEQLVETLQLQLGNAAAGEAHRRLAQAINGGVAGEVDIWFAVWTELVAAPRR